MRIATGVMALLHVICTVEIGILFLNRFSSLWIRMIRDWHVRVSTFLVNDYREIALEDLFVEISCTKPAILEQISGLFIEDWETFLNLQWI